MKSFPEVRVGLRQSRPGRDVDGSGALSTWAKTTVMLKPESEWRPGMTWDKLVDEMDKKLRLPGVANAWTMPIKNRIDMLSTGIRTPVGIKIFGPDLAKIEEIGKHMETVLQTVPGTRNVLPNG